MEVSLVSSNGLPPEAILSIRAGSIRRQGPVNCGRALRFPQREKPSEGDQVLKVDIHQKVGTGYLVLKPNQDGSKQYRVVLSGDCGQVSEMSCELEVKPAAAPAGDNVPTAEEPEENATAAKAKDATEYLKDKGVLQFVQGVLQVVVKEQPEDPFSLMAKHFQDGYDVPAMSRPSTALVEKVANLAKEVAEKPILPMESTTRATAEEEAEKATGKPAQPLESIKSEKEGALNPGDTSPGGNSVRFTKEDDQVLGIESAGMRSCRDRAATGGWTSDEMKAAMDELDEADEVPSGEAKAGDAAAGEETPKPE